MSVLVISVTLLFVLSGNFRPIQGKNILGPLSERGSSIHEPGNSISQETLTLGRSANFARVYKLPDGEIVTKLQLYNTTAIETQYNDIDLIQVCSHVTSLFLFLTYLNYFLSQIIQGENIIQLWKSNDELIDCEFTNDLKKLNSLRKEFQKENPNIQNDKRKIRVQNLE